MSFLYPIQLVMEYCLGSASDIIEGIRLACVRVCVCVCVRVFTVHVCVSACVCVCMHVCVFTVHDLLPLHCTSRQRSWQLFMLYKTDSPINTHYLLIACGLVCHS